MELKEVLRNSLWLALLGVVAAVVLILVLPSWAFWPFKAILGAYWQAKLTLLMAAIFSGLYIFKNLH